MITQMLLHHGISLDEVHWVKHHPYDGEIIKEGFLNKIDPKIISHPANCQLLLHKDNIKKYINSSITLNELYQRIIKWNDKYKPKGLNSLVSSN